MRRRRHEEAPWQDLCQRRLFADRGELRRGQVDPSEVISALGHFDVRLPQAHLSRITSLDDI